MKRVFTTTIVICMCLGAGISCNKIIHVPGDQPTIQAGIDAAEDGGVVVVADGTYKGDGNKDLDFKGKAITVTSENGAFSTIIDCENDGRGFYFQSRETSDAIVDGFTIINGFADSGGGILCDNSSPTIKNNIIRNNLYHGIHINDCDSIIQSEIINNWIYSNGGSVSSGIYLYSMDSAAIIRNNTIVNNKGHGIEHQSGTSPVISNCIVWGNNDGQLDDCTASYSCIENGDTNDYNINSIIFRSG